MRIGTGSLVTALVVVLLQTAAASAARPATPQPGDAGIFETWTGYQSGRFLEAVVSADLNGDGHADAAWARQDFVQNRMQVQLNLGDGTLGPSVGYPAQLQSNDIAVGDLDGDGDPDLVVISEGDDLANNVIDLYFNNGNGTFTRTTDQGGHGPTRLALADLDSDLDLALANFWSQAGNVSVLLNNGNGSFAPEALYPIGSRPHGITAADLDGDGDLDLAVVRENAPTAELTLLRNDGDGAFSSAGTLALDLFAESPVVVDANWDGDGDRDLAVSGLRTEQVDILENNGNFAFAETLVPDVFASFNLRAADIEADGDTDIVSASFGSSSGELTLLRNTGSGAFAAPVQIESGNNPHDMDVGDYDGDGRLDLAVANRVTDTGAIHPQREDGSFESPPIYETAGQIPLSVATADLDGDGDIDVAEGSGDLFGTARVEILLNSGNGTLVPAGEIPACSICQAGIVPYVRSVFASDLNGDAAPDLVWAPDAPPYPYVYALNNGNGSFGAIHESTIATCGTGKATTADADNDGDQDVLVANNRSGPGCESVDDTVRVALNNGDGTFQPDYGVTVFPLPEMAIGADVTGDGMTDLVSSSTQVSVARGTGGGAFAPPVDYDARGTELTFRDVDVDGDLDRLRPPQQRLRRLLADHALPRRGYPGPGERLRDRRRRHRRRRRARSRRRESLGQQRRRALRPRRRRLRDRAASVRRARLPRGPAPRGHE